MTSRGRRERVLYIRWLIHSLKRQWRINEKYSNARIATYGESKASQGDELERRAINGRTEERCTEELSRGRPYERNNIRSSGSRLLPSKDGV
jgi:hypothetical protein